VARPHIGASAAGAAPIMKIVIAGANMISEPKTVRLKTVNASVITGLCVVLIVGCARVSIDHEAEAAIASRDVAGALKLWELHRDSIPRGNPHSDLVALVGRLSEAPNFLVNDLYIAKLPQETGTGRFVAIIAMKTFGTSQDAKFSIALDWITNRWKLRLAPDLLPKAVVESVQSAIEHKE
jgi:hypothetical protein